MAKSESVIGKLKSNSKINQSPAASSKGNNAKGRQVKLHIKKYSSNLVAINYNKCFLNL